MDEKGAQQDLANSYRRCVDWYPTGPPAPKCDYFNTLQLPHDVTSANFTRREAVLVYAPSCFLCFFCNRNDSCFGH
jgi:hypothetical protein